MGLLITRRNKERGFTIVELLVVIVVIGILATIVIVSYGGWKASLSATQVKNDLAAAAQAMENYVAFKNVYPNTIPTSATTSPSVHLSSPVLNSDSTTYCIDAYSDNYPTDVYYISNATVKKGAQSGNCGGNPGQTAPLAPANLAFTSSTSTTVGLSWSGSTGATSYTAQCSTDSGYITEVKQQTVMTTTATVTGFTSTTTVNCRVNAINSAGTSAWSGSISQDTNTPSCADTNQYGPYPACYDYDSFPVATSIQGFWTTAPDGYLLEDGSAVSRTTYADLFAAIGTTYGAGDGSTTFNLPDSRGRASVNKSTDTEFDTVGEKYGEKTHVLLTAEMPSHNHSFTYQGGKIATLPYTGNPNTAYGLAFSVGTTVYSSIGISSTGSNTPHNVIQPSIVEMYAIKYRPSTGSASTLPAASSIEGYWTSAPTGYLLEDGSAVSRTTYADLFAAIGTTYGAGNGSSTFNLPDSRGRVSVNLSSTDTEFNTIGKKYGEKTHTLTISEMAAHSHNFTYAGNQYSAFPYTGSPNTSYGLAFSVGSPTYGSVGISSTGSNTAYNVIQPSIVKVSAIKYSAASGSEAATSTASTIQGYWSSVPSGYLAEDGSAVSRTTYADLFAVIGTTYGVGNGSTTFNLPDSRGRIGVNKSTDTEFDTMGEKYGEKAHTLTVAELASHNHYFTYNGGCCNNWPYTGGPNLSGGIAFSVGSPTYGSIGISSEGGGQAHNVIQPSIVKQFAIKY